MERGRIFHRGSRKIKLFFQANGHFRDKQNSFSIIISVNLVLKLKRNLQHQRFGFRYAIIS
uniref:Uncharacterized protein n=1 Tax=Octopus bimaculoides TaxID=37653 RepID=A0A0L8GV60_OCTBM